MHPRWCKISFTVCTLSCSTKGPCHFRSQLLTDVAVMWIHCLNVFYCPISSLKLLYTFNTQTHQVAFQEIGPTLVDTPKRYWNKLFDIKTFVQPAWSQINVYQILKTLTTSSWVFLDTCLENLTPKRVNLCFLEKSPKMIRGLRSPKNGTLKNPSVSCSKDEEHFPMILPGP